MGEDDVIARPVASAPTTKSADAKAGQGRAYDADVCGWAMDQAAHIRAGRYDLLDVANVAEEIESLGRREFDVLVSDLDVIVLSMLKWDHQSERRARSWTLTIAEYRDRVEDRISDNPSFVPRRDEALVRAYELARIRTAIETDLPLSTFPAALPYTWTEVVDRPFVQGDE